MCSLWGFKQSIEDYLSFDWAGLAQDFIPNLNLVDTSTTVPIHMNPS